MDGQYLFEKLKKMEKVMKVYTKISVFYCFIFIFFTSLLFFNQNTSEAEGWIGAGKINVTLKYVEFYEGLPVYTLWSGTREKSLPGGLEIEVIATGLEENTLYFNSNWTLTLSNPDPDTEEPLGIITGTNQGTMNMKSRHFIEKGTINWDQDDYEYINNIDRGVDIVVSGKLSDLNFVVGDSTIHATVTTLPPMPE
jgi:hypothetical protein